MTFVVTENCIKCKYMDCVDACPVDAFHEGDVFLVINSLVCIDCNVCVTECSANAIYQDKDLPENQKDFLEINEKLSVIWPQILIKSELLPDRDEWNDIYPKRHLLDVDILDL